MSDKTKKSLFEILLEEIKDMLEFSPFREDSPEASGMVVGVAALLRVASQVEVTAAELKASAICLSSVRGMMARILVSSIHPQARLELNSAWSRFKTNLEERERQLSPA